MAKQGREKLKELFRKGLKPTETSFGTLIDSLYNLEDDNLEDWLSENFTIVADKDKQRLISFYKDLKSSKKPPHWTLRLSSDASKLIFSNHQGKTMLMLKQNGHVGINTNHPSTPLDVRGTITATGRRGSYRSTSEKLEAPADGDWHPILSDLKGAQVFEVVAGLGNRFDENGRYALMHSIVTCVPKPKGLLSMIFGARNKIKVTQSFTHDLRSKMDLRWVYSKAKESYDLEVRTRMNYGGGLHIAYHITDLWFDPFMEGALPKRS